MNIEGKLMYYMFFHRHFLVVTYVRFDAPIFHNQEGELVSQTFDLFLHLKINFY